MRSVVLDFAIRFNLYPSYYTYYLKMEGYICINYGFTINLDLLVGLAEHLLGGNT